METILKKITDAVRRDLAHSFDECLKLSPLKRELGPPLDVISRLKKSFFFMAEVKRGSPSKGIIRRDFHPVSIALDYEQAGASAISVVTEKNFFYGDRDYLKQIKQKVRIPVMRKDFLLHPCQIYESFALGADFVLLIAACLSDQELRILYRRARSLGMEALVEVHREKELERVLALRPMIIGINNRNLNTFKVDIKTSFRLKKLIPPDIFVISESGIRTHKDIFQLRERGFSGALVGEALLKEIDVGQALRRLVHGED